MIHKGKIMALQCGIVGLPNVGKSTIFNALTSAKAQAANFPFCTIEPNTGAVAVPDPRLAALSEIVEPEQPCACYFQPRCTAPRFCLETLRPETVRAAVARRAG